MQLHIFQSWLLSTLSDFKDTRLMEYLPAFSDTNPLENLMKMRRKNTIQAKNFSKLMEVNVNQKC